MPVRRRAKTGEEPKKRRRVTKKDIDVIQAEVVEEVEDFELVDPTLLTENNLLSSGNCLFNLACSNTPFGAFLAGNYYWLAGVSGGGKTIGVLTIFAEANLHPRFKKYYFIYDNIENGAFMDFGKYFGKGTAKKIQSPEPGRKTSIGDGPLLPQPDSRTTEEFYQSLEDWLDKVESEDTGFIYVLDSADGLTSEFEINKIEDNKAKRKKGSATTGAMSDGKAKANSVGLRTIVPRLKRSGSFLFVISQIRDNQKSVHGGSKPSGGHALKFYACLYVDFLFASTIKTTYNGNEFSLGVISKTVIKKNRQTGKKSFEILMPIYDEFGFDNIGAQVNWLIKVKKWSLSGKKVNTKDVFGNDKDKESLCRFIDENDLIDELEEVTLEAWNKIKDVLANRVVRKRRYE